MAEMRDDLDGKRLYMEGEPDVWLVFGGERHHVSGPDVYENLFAGSEGLIAIQDPFSIALGSRLTSGSVLVRAWDRPDIFLVTGSPPAEIRKHYITTLETFRDFGFSEAKILSVLPILVSAIKSGVAIQSAEDRVRQKKNYELELASRQTDIAHADAEQTI